LFGECDVDSFSLVVTNDGVDEVELAALDSNTGSPAVVADQCAVDLGASAADVDSLALVMSFPSGNLSRREERLICTSSSSSCIDVACGYAPLKGVSRPASDDFDLAQIISLSLGPGFPDGNYFGRVPLGSRYAAKTTSGRPRDAYQCRDKADGRCHTF
jgi:hypothetical protein